MQVIEALRDECKGSIAEFQKRYHVTACAHPSSDTWPLVIFNYDRAGRGKRSALTDACRGLVIDVKEWTIAARGFDRFSVASLGTTIERIQSKEDGTLMLVFRYRNQWFVNCRHNFGDDFVPFGRSSTSPVPVTLTYRELLTRLLPAGFFEQQATQDSGLTFLFEMCTLDNRVVRRYTRPRLFLLGAHTGTEELGQAALDDWAVRLHVERPRDYTAHEPFATQLAACLRKSDLECAQRLVGDLLLSECAKEDKAADDSVCREGVVVVYAKNGGRRKIKNPLYLALHLFKYRNWPAAYTPIGRAAWQCLLQQLDKPFIRQALADLGANVTEIESAFGHVKTRFHPLPYCSPQPPLLLDGGDDDDDHKDKQHKDGLASCVPRKGATSWQVTCTCGRDMQLLRTKRDHVAPQLCYCGSRTGPLAPGVYMIGVGRLAWFCTDDACNNTHEAHQEGEQRGQPLGIPCTRRCKIYRLHVHALFDQLWNKNNKKRASMTKSEAYQWLADQLGCSRDEAHVARFGIATCRRALVVCQLALSLPAAFCAAGCCVCGLITSYMGTC